MVKFLADAKTIEIRSLEVVKETEQTVWVSEPKVDKKPIRMAKYSERYDQLFCDTWAEAVQYIERRVQKEVELAKSRLSRAQELMAKSN